MPPIRTILVAIKNPMARSLPAVDKAAQLARAFDARLELFHAIAAPVNIDPIALGLSPDETRLARLPACRACLRADSNGRHAGRAAECERGGKARSPRARKRAYASTTCSGKCGWLPAIVTSRAITPRTQFRDWRAGFIATSW